ncbi:vomeronasal type-2 receptor 26-like [Heteronotia binoei]|uniref:vomeronasal type-2 receptor 26-like n=1 Tax=Heteronotia binoei TaxID=13085 RepID=UPI00292E9A01|nr:vomeronasal type-2 receptor 26-like [Heteronotia binoei]
MNKYTETVLEWIKTNNLKCNPDKMEVLLEGGQSALGNGLPPVMKKAVLPAEEQVAPSSLCNENCRPGYSKKKQEGKPFCCYDCISCPDGKISNQMGSLIQVIICIIWLCTAPPFPNVEMNSLAQEIVIECSKGSIVMFYCVLGFLGFLALPKLNSKNHIITRHCQETCISRESVDTKHYQHILALAFAVKEINHNPRILPNITLGFHLYDSNYNAHTTFKATLHLLSSQHELVPNYKCDVQNTLAAVIGGFDSMISIYMATLLKIYKTPQLSYGSVLSGLNDKRLFSSLYKMVPNDSHQYKGIVQLLVHFKWIWVGLFVLDDVNGETFLQILIPLFSQNGICFAFINRTQKLSYADEMFELFLSKLKTFESLMESKANVFVVHGAPPSMEELSWHLHLVELNSPKGKVWVVTAHWEFGSKTYQRDWDIRHFHGAISLSIHSNQPAGFRTFLQSVRPSWAKKDSFIKDFWERAFNCLLKEASESEKPRETCTGEEKLENLPGPFFEMSMIGHSYNIYNAVYAIANALHVIFESHSKFRLKPQNLKAWKLNYFLRRISFNNSVGDVVRFDENGELIEEFDVTNWVTFPNNSFVRVKVGSVDPHAPTGKELKIQDENLVWHEWFSQVLPLSLCNDQCQPGYRKRKKEGEPFCCYDCVPCSHGKISDKKDMDDCFKCPEDQYPNKVQDQCLRKRLNFLSFYEMLGITLCLLACCLALITAVTLGIFIKHQDTPIVRANNHDLSYILLISLFFCFLSSLLFLIQPGTVICPLRQVAFGLIFSVAICCILAKTITVVVAFMATQPGSSMKRWVGRRLAFPIVVSGFLIQVVICIIWLCTAPPFPNVEMNSLAQEIVVECSKGSVVMFYCVLGFLGLLALVSFIVAFFARHLPSTFNEAKFITFSMLVFCSVWLSFVPSYLSTKGKYMVAVEIFSILSSGAGLLGCIFAPKCFIIILRPKLNSKDRVIMRHGQKI